MAGNRKHGFLRDNRGGFKPQPWFCDGCKKTHPYKRFRNGVLTTGKSYCDRTYYKLSGVSNDVPSFSNHRTA